MIISYIMEIFSVKAGGMRITQHKSPKEEQPKPTKQDAEEAKTSTRSHLELFAFHKFFVF